jgi:hypothetical protein
VRVPKGIDTGFGHNPGQRSLDRVIPRPPKDGPLVTLEEMTGGDPLARPRILSGPSALPPRPEPRVVPPGRILPPDLQPEEYVRRFLAEFGADIGRPAPFTDAAGGHLLVGDALFRDRHTDEWKATKRGRHPYLLLGAEAIRDPDEIWAALQVVPDGQGGQRVRLVRRYLAWFRAPDRTRTGFAIFELVGDTWRGVTTFDQAADSEGEARALRQLDRQRTGILLYRKGG